MGLWQTVGCLEMGMFRHQEFLTNWFTKISSSKNTDWQNVFIKTLRMHGNLLETVNAYYLFWLNNLALSVLEREEAMLVSGSATLGSWNRARSWLICRGSLILGLGFSFADWKWWTFPTPLLWIHTVLCVRSLWKTLYLHTFSIVYFSWFYEWKAVGYEELHTQNPSLNTAWEDTIFLLCTPGSAWEGWRLSSQPVT